MIPEWSVRIHIDDKGAEITATREDNDAAKDFLSLLPLNAADAPAGIDPTVGDTTYYAPWGSLEIFYRDFGTRTGQSNSGRSIPASRH